MTVTGTGAMGDYTATKAKKDYYTEKENITKITVSSGITKVGNYNFMDFDQCTNIELAETVTEIGTQAFSGVAALQDAIEKAQQEAQKDEATKEDLESVLTALEKAMEVDATGLADAGLKKKADSEHLGSFAVVKHFCSGQAFL